VLGRGPCFVRKVEKGKKGRKKGLVGKKKKKPAVRVKKSYSLSVERNGFVGTKMGGGFPTSLPKVSGVKVTEAEL